MDLHIESFALGLCFAPLITAAAWYLVCGPKCGYSKKQPDKTLFSLENTSNTYKWKDEVQSSYTSSFHVTDIPHIPDIPHITPNKKPPEQQAQAASPINVSVTLDADQIVKELKQITKQTAALAQIKRTTDAWYDSALHTNARRPKRV